MITRIFHKHCHLFCRLMYMTQRESVRSASGKLQGKELDKFREKYDEAIKNQLAEYQLKRQKRCAKDSPSLDRQKKIKNPRCRIRVRLSDER